MKTKLSPSNAMKNWLISGEVNSTFTIDQDCELSGIGKGSASIRYTHYSLDEAEIKKHIKAGMEVSKLALTWDNKISFILQNNLQIKRIVPLDFLKDQTLEDDNEDLFDAELFIMISEFQKLFVHLAEVLGGEV
jgi:recombination associated protein RdgC